jgi:hypothetical protein
LPPSEPFEEREREKKTESIYTCMVVSDQAAGNTTQIIEMESVTLLNGSCCWLGADGPGQWLAGVEACCLPRCEECAERATEVRR